MSFSHRLTISLDGLHLVHPFKSATDYGMQGLCYLFFVILLDTPWEVTINPYFIIQEVEKS
jgi:hypothetical protein